MSLTHGNVQWREGGKARVEEEEQKRNILSSSTQKSIPIKIKTINDGGPSQPKGYLTWYVHFVSSIGIRDGASHAIKVLRTLQKGKSWVEKNEKRGRKKKSVCGRLEASSFLFLKYADEKKRRNPLFFCSKAG